MKAVDVILLVLVLVVLGAVGFLFFQRRGPATDYVPADQQPNVPNQNQPNFLDKLNGYVSSGIRLWNNASSIFGGGSTSPSSSSTNAGGGGDSHLIGDGTLPLSY